MPLKTVARKTDVFLKDCIISRRVWNNKKLRNRALKLSDYILTAQRVVGVTKPVITRFCTLGGKWEGMAHEDGRVVEIDVSQNSRTFNGLIVMMHELVHCRQFQTGQLRYSFTKDAHYWKGKKFSYDDHTEYVAYMKLPWEVEAYKLQRKLATIAKLTNDL